MSSWADPNWSCLSDVKQQNNHFSYSPKSFPNRFMIFFGIFLIVCFFSAIVFLIGLYINNSSKKDNKILNSAGEGFFNLAVNDTPVVYTIDKEVYLGFIDGNVALMMINNMESLEKFKFVDDIDKINELNTQARGQAVIIYFVVSLVITYFVYKIYLRNEMAAFSVQTSEHLEEKSNEIPIYANKGTSSPSDTVKSVCPHCNKEFQDNLSGTDCPDCGGTIL